VKQPDVELLMSWPAMLAGLGRPTRFAINLAGSLENQAAILSALGRDAEGQAAHDAAAAIRNAN
jgi:hypothetical protein